MKTFLKKIIAYILRLESQLVIFKYKPKIITITGSVGKTSTKDAVFAVLSAVSYVRKSEKSYNSEIGLPLTILGVPNGWNNPFVWLQNILKGLWLFVVPHKYPEWLVLEVGVGRPGDMRRTASWLPSDVVIITAMGETPAHIEFFYSRENLIEEKRNLVKTLKKGGLLILNADDEDVLAMQRQTGNADKGKHRVITYGFKSGTDVLGSAVDISYSPLGVPGGVIFRADVGGSSLPVVIEGVFGKNHIYATLAALALALGLKLNIEGSISSLKNYDVPPGRMRLLPGINDSMIIDDTYNSSPAAGEAALRTLGEVKTRKEESRKIAVLGDMLELGRHTEEAHKNIGRIAAGICDALIVVGPRAEAISSGVEEANVNKMNKGSIFEFPETSAAAKFMQSFVQKGDLVLVKGSQSMRMERVVEAILFDKENKNKLLVRQEKEWLRR